MEILKAIKDHFNVYDEVFKKLKKNGVEDVFLDISNFCEDTIYNVEVAEKLGVTDIEEKFQDIELTVVSKSNKKCVVQFIYPNKFEIFIQREENEYSDNSENSPMYH